MGSTTSSNNAGCGGVVVELVAVMWQCVVVMFYSCCHSREQTSFINVLVSVVVPTLKRRWCLMIIAFPDVPVYVVVLTGFGVSFMTVVVGAVVLFAALP